MKYKFLYLYFCAFVLKECVGDGNIGSCQISGGSNSIDFDALVIDMGNIKDNETFTDTYDVKGNLAITSGDNKTTQYIEVVAEPPKLIVRTAEAFTSLEEDKANVDTTSPLSIWTTVQIICTDDNTSKLFVLKASIVDVNNHPPTFKVTNFEYTMPAPLMPGIDLGAFGDPIIATDIDLSNTDVDFSTSNTNFDLRSIRTATPKEHQLQLYAAKSLTFDSDITLTVIATDKGVPPLSSTPLTITITKDKDKSQPDYPKFSQSIYTFDYSDNEGTPSITSTDGTEITVESTNPDNLHITISDDTYVTSSYDPETKIVKIESNGMPIKSVDSILFLRLTATTADDSSTEAAIAINVPGDQKANVPIFSSPYYIAQYSVNSGVDDTVDVDTKITVTENAEVTLSGDDHFEINYETDQWILSVTRDLDPSTLNTGEDIVLTLNATVTDGSTSTVSAYATIVVQLPKPIEFTQTHYHAEYAEHKVTIQDGDIDTKTDTDTVEITFEPPDDNFDIRREGGKWNVFAKNTSDLPEESVILTLKATVPDGKVAPGFSTLVITIPSLDPLHFNSPYYKATYSDSGSPSVTIDDDTITVDSKNEVTVTFDDSEPLASNFKIDKKETGYDITIQTALPNSVLITTPDIVLTLVATDSANNVAKATLIIQLPKETAPPAFDKDLYEGTYKIQSSLDTIDVDSIILEGKFIEDTKVTLSTPDGLEDNFAISDSMPYNISVSKDLDASYISSHQEIVLTVEATLTGSTVKSIAAVVITLPTLEPPNFRNPVYTAIYKVQDSKPVVEVDDPQIEVDDTDISTDDLESVKITVENPYNTNFEVVYNKADENFKISVLEPLDTTESEIYLILDASSDATFGHTSAVVALRMEAPSSDIVPQFSRTFYIGNYSVENDSTDTLTIETIPITIISDRSSETEVRVIDTYEKNFEAQFDAETKSWLLNVKEKLVDPTLNENEIVVILEASLPGSLYKGTATLIVGLPNPDHLKATPLFGESIYKTTYTPDEKKPTLTPVNITIISSGDEEFVEVTLEDYKSNFNITRTDAIKAWNIRATDPLSPEVIRTYSELIIPLKASLAGSVGSSFATLQVTLPNDKIQFNAYYYEVNYVGNGSSSDTLSTPDQITVTVGSEVSIQDGSEYKDNFNIICKDNNDKRTCELNIEKPLDEDTLSSETEIVLVLEASKDTSQDKATSTIIISLPLKEAIEAPQFEEVLYTTKYQNNTLDTVTVQVKSPSMDIDVTVTGKYSDNFDVTRHDNHWEITSTILSQNILDTESSIPLILVAEKTGVAAKGEATLVVQLPKETVNSASFHFDSNVYFAIYNEAGPSLEFSKDILITGDGTGVTVATSGDNKKLVQVTYDDGKVTVSINGDWSNDILNKAIINIDLVGTKLDTDEFDTTTVVVTLPKGSTSFYFIENVYKATYYDNDTISFDNGKKLTVGGDDDKSATFALTGDYSTYFTTSYDGNVVTISVKTPLPNDLKKSSITLIVVASRNDEQTNAAVVIELPAQSGGDNGTKDHDDDGDDKTGLIVAVAVLAVALVGALVGSAVFYYFKFRRGSTTEELYPEKQDRFMKNSAPGATKIDHPTRRPTGVIKFPLNNEDIGETITDNGLMEKRKSVQFDTTNIDELEIEKAEDVDDNDEVETNDQEDDKNGSEDNDDGDDDNNENRRVSKV